MIVVFLRKCEQSAKTLGTLSTIYLALGRHNTESEVLATRCRPRLETDLTLLINNGAHWQQVNECSDGGLTNGGNG